MDWTVETLSVLLTGVLFVGIVVAGLFSRATLSTESFVAFGAAGVVFVAAAFALVRVQAVNYPPFMWALPVLPLLVIGVLSRDAVTARRASARPEHVTAIARPDDERPLVAPAEAPAVPSSEAGRGDEGSARRMAASLETTPNQLAHMAINYPELRPIIASNPLTPHSVLQWLAHRGEPAAIAALGAVEDDAAAAHSPTANSTAANSTAANSTAA